MIMRTQEERTAAVARLKENKTKCRKRSFFGDDNHAAIDVMVDVIENERTEAYVYDTYSSDSDEEHRLFTSAISALEYLRGEIELSDILFPEK